MIEDKQDVGVKTDVPDEVNAEERAVIDRLSTALESQMLPLTARAIAIGAFVGVTFLTFAMLGTHALFTYVGLDDGGAVKDLLTITVGGVMTLLGMVGAKLFGSAS